MNFCSCSAKIIQNLFKTNQRLLNFKVYFQAPHTNRKKIVDCPWSRSMDSLGSLFYQFDENKYMQSSLVTFTEQKNCTSKPRGRLHKFLWPSQKSWTLRNTLYLTNCFDICMGVSGKWTGRAIARPCFGKSSSQISTQGISKCTYDFRNSRC